MHYSVLSEIRAFRRNSKSLKHMIHHYAPEPDNFDPFLRVVLKVYNKVRSFLPGGDLRLSLKTLGAPVQVMICSCFLLELLSTPVFEELYTKR